MFETSYGGFVLAGFVAAYLIKRHDEGHLGYHQTPGYRVVAVGALLGAVIGSKLGMLLYLTPAEWMAMMSSVAAFKLGGKTILGALAGGYIGVELAKRAVGITHSTGDAYAIALPIGQAIGRLGCFFSGCCFGTPMGTSAEEVHLHPVQLYEAAGLIALAVILVAHRRRTVAAGQLFRGFLIGFALLRLVLDVFRGDARRFVVGGVGHGVSWVQVYCVVAIALVAALVWRTRQEALRAPAVA